jgi:transposase
MDNGTFHKGLEMVNALKSAGHTLFYLPPYSQDLNAIEKFWAQVKALRRKIGGTLEELFKDQNL